jgi:hypothetical protein
VVTRDKHKKEDIDPEGSRLPIYFACSQLC